MSDRIATAAYWGIYEGQRRTDGGLPEMRPDGDDSGPCPHLGEPV